MCPVVFPPQRPIGGIRTKEEGQRQRQRRRRSTSAPTATFLAFPASSWVLLLLSASLLPFLPHAATTTTMASAAPIPFSSTPPMDPTPNLFRGIPNDSLLARTMTSQQGAGSGGGDPYSVATPGAEPLRLSHGTTTVALVCEGGVIAAVDSRASMGSFVGSRTTQKVS